MREDSNFWSLPPFTILCWRTLLVITKHPEDGSRVAQRTLPKPDWLHSSEEAPPIRSEQCQNTKFSRSRHWKWPRLADDDLPPSPKKNQQGKTHKTHNKLKLNDDKTEALIISAPRISNSIPLPDSLTVVLSQILFNLTTLTSFPVFFCLFHEPFNVVVHFRGFFRSFRFKSFLSQFSPFVAQIKNFCSYPGFSLLTMFAKDLTGCFVSLKRTKKMRLVDNDFIFNNVQSVSSFFLTWIALHCG